jgi:L-ribulose-5-phosphate 4-epimerase
VEEGYEKNTGKVIIEAFEGRNPVYVPGVICRNHGPFAWGKDCFQAVYHAKVLEEVAKMDFITKLIKADAPNAPDHIKEKHFQRKHGPNAYYGQGK